MQRIAHLGEIGAALVFLGFFLVWYALYAYGIKCNDRIEGCVSPLPWSTPLLISGAITTIIGVTLFVVNRLAGKKPASTS